MASGVTAADLEELADEHSFSGVVRIDGPEGTVEHARGDADRRWQVPMTVSTPMSIASGTKGFTALVVMRLVEAGHLNLTTTARSLLGDDLELIDDAVTVEQLLAHRSGIGDYLDEDELGDIADYVMPVPVQELDAVEAYLPILDGYPQVFEPGTRFAYNNSGYVVLALLAERAAGRPFAALVDELVCRPAGLTSTAFLRSDRLPAGVATGYLHAEGTPNELQTNALHLPVLGGGDGGLFSTAADMTLFWRALFEGVVVAPEILTEMIRPHSVQTGERFHYGMGFWLGAEGPIVRLVGYDAGVSFASWHNPETGLTHSVLSNTSEGAWPMARSLEARR